MDKNAPSALILELGDSDRFQARLQEFLEHGYKLSSSHCYCDENGAVYQAILVKELNPIDTINSIIEDGLSGIENRLSEIRDRF